MAAYQRAARLRNVTTSAWGNEDERDRTKVGQDIARRREALGLKKAELARYVPGRGGRPIDRGRVIQAEAGKPTVSWEMVSKIERALERLETERGIRPAADDETPSAPATSPHLVTFKVMTPDGEVAVVVEGPVADTRELEAATARLIAEIRQMRKSD